MPSRLPIHSELGGFYFGRMRHSRTIRYERTMLGKLFDQLQRMLGCLGIGNADETRQILQCASGASRIKSDGYGDGLDLPTN